MYSMPELRKDPVTGRWVIMATERSKRPMEFRIQRDEKSAGYCPFCPGNEDATPGEVLSISNGDGWSVRVVPNLYPALRVEGVITRDGDGIYDRMNGIGAHEVVIESPIHDEHLATMPDGAVADVLIAFRERILDLQQDVRLKYLMVFKNYGTLAGATLSHPHAQLIAMPITPLHVAEEMVGAERYYDSHTRCLFCDMVRQERRDGRRMVDETDHFVVFAPYASRFPFELWLLPKQHRSHFETSGDGLLRELATVLKSALGRLRTELQDPPFNFYLHNAPVGEAGRNFYHWHIEIIPALQSKVAGFELGSGFHINPTLPETAAEFLR
jgi:UDPglucose--hexose-1-phosphate uridylyltransferase